VDPAGISESYHDNTLGLSRESSYNLNYLKITQVTALLGFSVVVPVQLCMHEPLVISHGRRPGGAVDVDISCNGAHFN
jgi:hypothetical protein